MEYLLAGSFHFGNGILDGLFGHAMGNEPAAELLDRGVLGPLRFPFSQVLAETIRDVGPDEGLVASKAE